jgi:anti-sigma factor RsiW
MDCTAVASRLVPYHFATLSDEDRAAVDAHLLGCRACLRSYLALKHATERGVERPSDAVRARLRAEVARTFAPRRSRRLFARRIPLYQGVALAAVAAVIAFVAAGRPRFTRVDEPIPQVDTSRPHAESVELF